MTRNLGNKILLAILIAAVIFFAVGFLVLQHRSNQIMTVPPVTQPDQPGVGPVVNKDYTNTHFGFRFTYPPVFNDPVNTDFTSSAASANSNNFKLALASDNTAFLHFIVQSLPSDSANSSLDQLITSQAVKIKSKSTVNLGSETAVRAKIADYEEIFAKHNDYLIMVGIHQGVDAKNLDALNSVIDSFQFTGPVTTQDDKTKQPTVQSFTIVADDTGADPAEITVASGTIVDLTFSVSANNVYHGGLEFKSSVINTGTILPGSSKTVAFTATQSFEFIPYWPANGVQKSYTVKVTVQ